MNDLLKLIGWGIVLVVVVVAATVLQGALLMLLWNWLATKIFGLQTLNLLEAIGFSLLTQMLTGSGISFSKKNK